jgi:biopolymer transport protein ExbD
MAGDLGGIKVGRSHRPAVISNINITPLCDILLVLLIIFMVASTYIVQQTLKVELPKSASSDGPSSTPTILTVEHTGVLRWNGQILDEVALKERLRGAVAANPELELVLSADEKVLHGRVVHFMDIAKLAGINRFAINVEQSK